MKSTHSVDLQHRGGPMETENNDPDRFQLGKGEKGWLVMDGKSGWVKGWFTTRHEAEMAMLRLELGLDTPPEPTHN